MATIATIHRTQNETTLQSTTWNLDLTKWGSLDTKQAEARLARVATNLKIKRFTHAERNQYDWYYYYCKSVSSDYTDLSPVLALGILPVSHPSEVTGSENVRNFLFRGSRVWSMYDAPIQMSSFGVTNGIAYVPWFDSRQTIVWTDPTNQTPIDAMDMVEGYETTQALFVKRVAASLPTTANYRQLVSGILPS